MISVVVLQKREDLLQNEPGSCDETRETSRDGNEVFGIEAERVSDISDVVNQENMTIPAVKTEPDVSYVPVVSVTHISYRLYTDST